MQASPGVDGATWTWTSTCAPGCCVERSFGRARTSRPPGGEGLHRGALVAAAQPAPPQKKENLDADPSAHEHRLERYRIAGGPVPGQLAHAAGLVGVRELGLLLQPQAVALLAQDRAASVADPAAQG
jgi:hypothetical protein